MKTVTLNEKDFNNFDDSDERLNRWVVCFNDGQNDHCVYTYKKILELAGPFGMQIYGKSRTEIIDIFYDDNDLTGNISDELYFDTDGEYKNVEWEK